MLCRWRRGGGGGGGSGAAIKLLATYLAVYTNDCDAGEELASLYLQVAAPAQTHPCSAQEPRSRSSRRPENLIWEHGNSPCPQMLLPISSLMNQLI